MSRGIVTYQGLGRYGRFANQAFQIASTIGVARRNGMQFAFPYWKNYDHAERFGSTEDIDVQKHFANPLPVYNGPVLPGYFVQWGYHDVRLNGSVSLSGHMQSQRYFDHCIDEVRWYFKMRIEQDWSRYCAVHIRLGDYDGGYHPRLDWSYYGAAIKLMPKDTKFLLFSDDMKAAVKLFTSHHIEVYPYEADYLHSFGAMKSCRHFIIGNSSYSAMAAILGDAPDKLVVAPDPWFGPKYTNITGNDIYNPDWQTIRWDKQLTTV